jgi:hypothetical protein
MDLTGDRTVMRRDGSDEKVTSRSGTVLYFGNASPNIGFPLLDCSFVDSS